MAAAFHNKEEDQKTLPRTIKLGVGIVLFVLFVVFFPFTWHTSSPMVSFIDTFYAMTPNRCLYRQIGPLNILWYGYALIFFSSLWLAYRNRRHADNSPRFFLRKGLKTLKTGAWIMLFILTFFQVKFQLRQFAFEYQHFKGEDVQNKYAQIYKQTYGFSRYCHQHISGYARARLLSDLYLEKGLGLFWKTELAYFLYPIDILKPDISDPDVLIMFMKDEPFKALPPGFHWFSPYDHKSLMAVRQGGRR